MRTTFLFGFAWLLLMPLPGAAGEIDLSAAVVVTPPQLGPRESRAVILLIEEVEKRTRIRWESTTSWPAATTPVIAVGPAEALDAFAGPYKGAVTRPPATPPEGYTAAVKSRGRPAPAVFVLGNDSRGLLFGIGRLLRELRMERDRVTLPDSFHVQTAPRYSLRGHQLGYRPKTNSYDGWDLPQWEQYFRDLAVFGANAVELIPPRSDDDADSPHFPKKPIDMMVGMSKLCDDYGLDVWIWYPALDRDYGKPATVDFALQEWADVFRRLPRIDAIFVPGGDPGDTPPRLLLNLLEKQTANLHRYHPKAQMWVSPQSFGTEGLDEFCEMLRKEEPAWLAGVVFGPQVRVPLPKLRQMVPVKYPIRRYPDITHSLRSEFPVPDWDVALALTLGREPINPRPLDQAHIFRLNQADAVGFLTYSEGCNDDVNKAVWSGLGWDPDADVREILRQYGRYFIGARHGDAFARGLLALEQNWRGPLLTNTGVDTTLRQFQDLERNATPRERLNWRFQQALYRAYYDAYERARLIEETAQEGRALDRLREAKSTGSLVALRAAEAVLDQADVQRPAADLRARVFELAEALFQSIRMQLSVGRYQAIAVGRGANLDTVDVPLNNRRWLRAQFARIREMPSESDRVNAIHALVHWDDPGPGGCYDELGNPGRNPHLVRGPGFAKDPAFYDSVRLSFALIPEGRISWCRFAEALYDTPLRMHYDGLDPGARYRLRVLYAGDEFRWRVRLTANEKFEIHPWQRKPVPFRPLEFDVPPEATAGGVLDLSWQREPGKGGAGRGAQVAEVWLMRTAE